MKFNFDATENITLSVAVKAAIPLLKKGRERSLITSREIKVNGKRVGEDILLLPGDSVDVFVPEAYLEKKDITIVYDDDNITVADKPVKTESETELPELLKERCGPLIPVHRLDTNTTGLIILAKNNTAAESLKAAFREKTIKKTYTATVCGHPNPVSGTVKSYLTKDPSSGIVTSGPVKIKGSVPAETFYNVVSSSGKYSRVLLMPVTGRTHQLRVHMALLGCPILGDGKYGNFDENKRSGAAYQQLRAVKLELGKMGSPLEALSGKIFTTDDYYEKKEKESQ